MTADRATPIATFENAYRVATRIADATDSDMQVAATGIPDRPFVAEPTSDRGSGVIVRIVAA